MKEVRVRHHVEGPPVDAYHGVQQSVECFHPKIQNENIYNTNFSVPDHCINRCDHGVSLTDEDVEDVAVEDGADETNDNIVRPQPGFELPLLPLAGIHY